VLSEVNRSTTIKNIAFSNLERISTRHMTDEQDKGR